MLTEADEMDDFVIDDDSDAPAKPSKKRKRPISTATSRKRSNVSPPTPYQDADEDGTLHCTAMEL
jgi:DNA mismatch repair protein MSH6